MATRTAVDINGNKIVYRNYTAADGSEQWVKINQEGAKPDGASESPTSSFNKDRQRELLAQEGGHIPGYQSDHFKYMGNLLSKYGIDSPEYQRAREAEQMGFGEKAMILAGRETDKLGQGLLEFRDFINDVTGDDKAAQRSLERYLREEDKDNIMEQIDEDAGLANAGAMLPYIVSGTLMGPMSRVASSKFLKGVEKVAESGSKATTGAITKRVDKIAEESGNVFAPLAKKIQAEFTDPIKREAMRKANQVKVVDRYRDGLLNNIIAGGGTGAVEGAVRYGDDTNFLTGAISGLLGTAAGKGIERPFRRTPVYWNEVEQANVDWAKDRGMRLLPGMETGSKRLQKFEHGLRETDQYADYLGDFDAANAAVMQREAAKSMGIDPSNPNAFSPESLAAHRKSLSDEYKYLEKSSVGRFSPSEYNKVKSHVESLKDNVTPQGKKAYRTASGYLEQLENISRPVRNAQGRMTKQVFDGAKYQDMMQQLKGEIDSAYTRGDNLTARGLEPLVSRLKNAMDVGVRDFGGIEGVARWNDLNERYAMTKLVMNNGMDVTNKFDARKLGNHLMSTDAERTLMEQGGRIKDLQKLAKVDHMMRNQAGSGLSGTNTIADNSGKLTLAQRLVSGSASGYIPILPSAYMAMYKRGIPSTRGLLSLIPNPTPFKIQGLTGKNAGDISRYTRAYSQGTQSHNDMIQGATNAYEYLTGEDKDSLYKKLMMMTQ